MFEILQIVLESLNRKVDPKLLMVPVILWSGGVPPDRLQDYLTALERIVTRSFDLMGSVGNPLSGYPQYYLPLNDSLRMIRKLDPVRLKNLVEQLMFTISDPEDYRKALLEGLIR